MNTKQKIVLWTGLSLIAILLVYPPYNSYYFSEANNCIGRGCGGHRSIITILDRVIDDRSGGYENMEIDIPRLLLETFLLVVITFGGIWAFRSEKDKII